MGKMNEKSLWAKKATKELKSKEQMMEKIQTILPVIMVFVLIIGCTSLYHATDAGQIVGDLLSTVKNVLVEVYAGLLGIVTVLAVVICAWCFIVKMFSKNQRSIEEANQWIKRVCIAWLCFMLLSVIVGFGIGVIGTANANTSTPWA